jgi:hypothetical protein
MLGETSEMSSQPYRGRYFAERNHPAFYCPPPQRGSAGEAVQQVHC